MDKNELPTCIGEFTFMAAYQRAHEALEPES